MSSTKNIVVSTSDDYQELREQFLKVVDIKDPRSVRKWFEEHSYLSIHDNCHIIGKCSREIRALRKFSGIKGRKPSATKRTSIKNASLAELPENWRTKDWLNKHIPIYGTMAIIKAAGISVNRYYQIIKKLGITPTGMINKNACCTKAWCHRHYIELNYSLRKCAKLAGVTHPTFADWLNKFKIIIRTHEGPVNVPSRVKLIFNKLKSSPIIREIEIMRTHLRVMYNDTCTVDYYFKRIPGDQWSINRKFAIKDEYEPDIDGNSEYKANIILAISKNATVFERDMAIHGLTIHYFKRGWIWPKFPKKMLEEELERLKAPRLSDIFRNGCLRSINSKKSTRYINLHFIDNSLIWDHFRRRRRLVFIIKRLVTKAAKSSRRHKINTYNIIIEMTRHPNVKFKKYVYPLFTSFKLPDPAMYAYMFKSLNVTGTVLDIYLGTGSRAIACALNGIEYLTFENPKFMKAVDDGFADFVGLKYNYYNDTVNSIDLVICDNDFGSNNIEFALSFAKKAKMIVAYVKNHDRDEYEKIYKPRSIIKIKNQLSIDNYYFIW